MGLKLIYGVPGSGKTYYASPSHPVGLEPKTDIGYGYESHYESPSHAVGLELKHQRIHIPTLPSPIWESPSHTVGLELAELDKILRDLGLSPSHPVGLEHI